MKPENFIPDLETMDDGSDALATQMQKELEQLQKGVVAKAGPMSMPN